MKYRIVTLLLLLASAALYMVGFGTGMVIALAAAVALEVYFWMRFVRGKGRRGPPIGQFR